MSDYDVESKEERKARKRAAKASGQDRIAVNLVARWLGQIVVIVSGFVIPRMIDDSLGAAALGIWDFAWSTVSYFRFMGFGLSGGLNRFVALYNAQEAYDDLKRAVTSTYFLQFIVATMTAIASVTISFFLPQIFEGITPEEAQQSQWVIILLGGNLAVRMVFWPSRSILTGYHRWAMTAGVTAAGDIVLLIGMVIILKSGGGIADLGMMVFWNAVVTETVRLIMSKRVYPFPMFIRASLDWKTMWKMTTFGMKNSLTSLPTIVAMQTTALALAAVAGPAALAVYARPVALFNHIDHLTKLYAFLLTPVAASLQGLKRERDLKAVLLTSLKSSFAITIPPIFLLAVYGDVIVEIWMGADYVVPILAPVLGCALIFPYAHAVAMRILVGLDAFAKLAAIQFLVTVIVLVAGMIIVSQVGWSPETAVFVVGASLVSGPGLVVMVGAARYFGVTFREYMGKALLPPLACNSILILVVVLSRVFDDDVTIFEAAAWAILGGLPVIALYWKVILTDETRTRVFAKLFRKRLAAENLAD